LQELPRETVAQVLEAAAQFRIQRKAARLVKLEAAHGEEQALYQAVAATLGYKANPLPFTLLAQRLPLRMLLENRQDAAALLFGMAGFLAQPDLSQYGSETRAYVRALWERWWARRAEFEGLILKAGVWNLAGLRPVNHPQRRLAALAQIVAHWHKLRTAAAACDITKLRQLFLNLRDEYWDSHYTLVSQPASARMALLGESRITDMLANVFYPRAILSDPKRWEEYRKLPAVLSNRRLETAATRLFGESLARKELLKTAVAQQGLLQIYEDFCMRDASDCDQCLFPKQVAQWRATG